MEKIEKNSNLPILSPEGSLNSYLLKISSKSNFDFSNIKPN